MICRLQLFASDILGCYILFSPLSIVTMALSLYSLSSSPPQSPDKQAKTRASILLWSIPVTLGLSAAIVIATAQRLSSLHADWILRGLTLASVLAVVRAVSTSRYRGRSTLEAAFPLWSILVVYLTAGDFLGRIPDC